MQMNMQQHENMQPVEPVYPILGRAQQSGKNSSASPTPSASPPNPIPRCARRKPRFAPPKPAPNKPDCTQILPSATPATKSAAVPSTAANKAFSWSRHGHRRQARISLATSTTTNSHSGTRSGRTKNSRRNFRQNCFLSRSCRPGMPRISAAISAKSANPTSNRKRNSPHRPSRRNRKTGI